MWLCVGMGASRSYVTTVAYRGARPLVLTDLDAIWLRFAKSVRHPLNYLLLRTSDHSGDYVQCGQNLKDLQLLAEIRAQTVAHLPSATLPIPTPKLLVEYTVVIRQVR